MPCGIPQGSIMGALLYLTYTYDLSCTEDVLTGTYANDTAVLADDAAPLDASLKLQKSLNKILESLKDWRIKANESKSIHVPFILRRETCPEVQLNQVNIPQLGRKVLKHVPRQTAHVDQTHFGWKALGQLLRKSYWLMNRKSQATALQSHPETDMDIWLTTVEHCLKLQC
ncbi:RNA-directed DNA polymerase from mobile element jockey [Eumeta japonica]|uniref:RNA-directed DNA polymerase from mobile element jockey n=1 Tax=Eumeta variegata TaxID=151549 RepID=A0A4C1YZD3_EUMVA|nr:RNA-directed DNA polymerase from mobile element jockey [Eumeta japonica]